MSLTRFKAKNHPQQVAENGADDDIDDRATPPEVFGPLHAIHGFTLDVAAAPHNAKCKNYFTKEIDGLSQSWTGETVWCNPPFSNIGMFVKKALIEITCGGCVKVVMLLPANRTEQSWWQDMIEPLRDYPGSIINSEFLPGRTRFIFPKGQEPSENRPPFGCVILTIQVPTRPKVFLSPRQSNPQIEMNFTAEDEAENDYQQEHNG